MVTFDGALDAAPDSAVLSNRERERYSRGRLFYRWIDLRPGATGWEPQLLLRAARMVVAGLGGTGGAAASALAASGVGRLHCVDSDTVEVSNLNRHLLYTEADLGRSKVDAAVERLRALNPDIVVTGERLAITGVDDLAGLAKGCDCWCCVPTGRARSGPGPTAPASTPACHGSTRAITGRSRPRPPTGPATAPATSACGAPSRPAPGHGSDLRVRGRPRQQQRGDRTRGRHLRAPGRTPGHRAADRRAVGHPGAAAGRHSATGTTATSTWPASSKR
ncbi:ThiF family adenylyltransferase [Asanoa sp. NPDC049573]|uniref:HesA/MoeB/ThiF family protein n=1 Tax=Asanoa sp. NPDC049573 TaxID=3155396 RepID=UPI003418EC69